MEDALRTQRATPQVRVRVGVTARSRLEVRVSLLIHAPSTMEDVDRTLIVHRLEQEQTRVRASRGTRQALETAGAVLP